jgi:predicted O-methyltransferase YrrM
MGIEKCMMDILEANAKKYNRPDIIRLGRVAAGQFVANIIDYQDEFKGKPTRYLEVGTWRGSSVHWIVDNFLTHPDSRAYCVDPWSMAKDSGFGRTSGILDVENRFKAYAKTQPKIIIKQGRSELVLRTCDPDWKPLSFDLVYIDGEHDIMHVLQDWALSWPLLKVGGIMVFDDYILGSTEEVKLAVDCILLGLGRVYKRGRVPRPRRYQLLFKNKQVGIRKIA